MPDPSEKFVQNQPWNGGQMVLTWKVLSIAGLDCVSAVRGVSTPCTVEGVEAAASAAFASWSRATGFAFSKKASGGTPFAEDIEIQAGDLGPFQAAVSFSPNLACSSPRPGLSISCAPRLVLDTSPAKWSVNIPPPADRYDVGSILLHEIGHILGLFHSSVGVPAVPATSTPARRAVMFGGTANTGVQDTFLHVDDEIAASAMYEGWQLMAPALSARDVGIGGDRGVWIVSSTAVAGGFQVKKWNGSTTAPGFDVASGSQGAVRIAVGANGRPWIVDSTGKVFQRSSVSAASGSWSRMGTVLATDIGVGGVGSQEAAYITGRTLVGADHRVYKWNGSDFVLDVDSTALGVNVSVDGSGNPWVINAAHDIYRRKDSGTSFEFSSTNGWDIGAGPTASASGNRVDYVYLVASDDASLWVWNKQAELPGAGSAAQAAWLRSPDAKKPSTASPNAIAVGPDGVPWITGGNQSLWRQKGGNGT
jgi:hypothetical protein